MSPGGGGAILSAPTTPTGGVCDGVELQPITKDNLADVYALAVAPGQEEFVAPNAWSLAQAYAEYEIAWPRAIVSDGTIVGFLMLEIDPEDEDGRPYWLWRLMLDARHQRLGHGTATVGLVIEFLRSLGATELYTSWEPGPAGPEGFYLRLGFVPTRRARRRRDRRVPRSATVRAPVHPCTSQTLRRRTHLTASAATAGTHTS